MSTGAAPAKRRLGAVRSSCGAAIDAADAALEAHGSAVDAAIAGWLAAAGEDPAVLLAPLVAVVAGVGVGARAFDGRPVQPGRGAARPRGYLEDAAVPDGARVATPRTFSMIAVIHSYHGRLPFPSLVRHGAQLAEACGAGARAAVLRRFGDSMALLQRDPTLRAALVAAGGPVSGGALTEADLENARPDEASAASEAVGDAAVVHAAPWVIDPDALSQSRAEAIVTADGRGTVAALAFCPPRHGVPLPEVELVVGRHAVPVLRGIARLPVGSPLPTAAPIAALSRGSILMAIASPGCLRPDAGAVRALATADLIDAEMVAGLGASALVAMWDGRAARAL